MQKTLEQAQKEAEGLFHKLPLPGEGFSRAIRDTWHQLTTRKQPTRRWGVLLEVRTPRTPLEKLSAHAKTAWFKLRYQLTTRFYRRLPPLYAVCLVKLKPDDIRLHRNKLERCVEAERLERETISKEMRNDYPALADAWSESGDLEDDVQALWQQLVEFCYDRLLFPVRSRPQNRVYFIEVSAEAEVHATGISYVEGFVDEAQARARLGEVTLVTLTPHGAPFWVSGTTLLSADTGEAWRALDRGGKPLELLKDAPASTVEIEEGGGQPYPVLVLPVRLERLEGQLLGASSKD